MAYRARRILHALLLRREQLVLAIATGLVATVSWTWIVLLARDMSVAMEGFAAWMMTGTWDATHLLLLWAMWAVMMAGMMLPSALPMILLYSRAARARRDNPGVMRQACALALGYMTVWALFSVGATILQHVLAEAMLLSPMMDPVRPAVAAVLLLVAGIYQMTPLKHACLRSCRSPLSFLMRRWIPGWAGALRMGIDHGFYCVGCCWALMLLLFAGGVMNLSVIAILTLWVVIEKLLPLGEKSAYLSGPLLILGAAWMAVAA